MTDEGTAYGLAPATYDKELTEVGAGTPMGELLRRYWHPVGLAADAGATPRPGARARRGPDPVSRRPGPAGPGASALRPSRRLALLRPGRGRGHPLLLSRLDVRGRRPLPRPAVRARGRQAPRQRPPALVSARGALRPGVRLPRPAGEEAAAAADRRARAARRGRVARGRRHQPRRRRPADHSLQLAAALGERGRQPARADPARRVLGPPVRAGDGADARGRVGDDRARRARHQLSRPRRRPAPAPRHRGGDADAAGRAEPAPRQLRPGRVDRLGAADRRRPLPHLRRRAGEAAGRHRPDALEDERQVLVGAERGRASRLPGRLRSPGRARARSPSHSAEHLRTSDRGVALLRRFLREQLAALARGDDPSGVARGPGADPMQRFANCGNFLAA